MLCWREEKEQYVNSEHVEQHIHAAKKVWCLLILIHEMKRVVKNNRCHLPRTFWWKLSGHLMLIRKSIIRVVSRFWDITILVLSSVREFMQHSIGGSACMKKMEQKFGIVTTSMEYKTRPLFMLSSKGGRWYHAHDFNYVVLHPCTLMFWATFSLMQMAVWSDVFWRTICLEER